jgi:hypothetical protein
MIESYSHSATLIWQTVNATCLSHYNGSSSLCNASGPCVMKRHCSHSGQVSASHSYMHACSPTLSLQLLYTCLHTYARTHVRTHVHACTQQLMFSKSMHRTRAHNSSCLQKACIDFISLLVFMTSEVTTSCLVKACMRLMPSEGMRILHELLSQNLQQGGRQQHITLARTGPHWHGLSHTVTG